MSDPIDIFRAEAAEHLATLEDSLLEMEQQADDPELVAAAFRAMHTLKGAGGMFGFDEISSFTHHLETAFDQVRNGLFKITPDFISVMLDAKDLIDNMLENPQQNVLQKALSDELLTRLAKVIPTDTSSHSEAQTEKLDEQTPSVPEPIIEKNTVREGEKSFRIRFTPAANAFGEGFDILPIVRELNTLGTCYTSTIIKGLPALDAYDAETCYLSFDIILVTSDTLDAIEDTFIFVVDDWQISIEEIETIDGDDKEAQPLGKILVDRGLVSESDVQEVLLEKPKTGELLQEAGLVSESEIKAALVEQKAIKENKEKKTKATQESNIRVPVPRLDTLMDLVGELVIVQARMKQLAVSRDDEEMIAVSEDLDRLSNDLRDNTFSIRMLPIGSTFSRFRRLVRDLSSGLGKEIQLETVGAETELDKMVIDRLGDPLVHLIRNSIDHGIESPEQREAVGKSKTGHILLSARHAESQVIIEIQDDGAGLNTEVIKNKAIERGLMSAGQELSDNEIHQMIFEPGFSTAQVVSDISGRGVGMDVVKRSIHELGGNIFIDSQYGRGTTIKINLPMTLAIIEGLMIAVSDERYVIPLSNVEECIEIRCNQDEIDNNRLVNIRGELVPYMKLREWFDVDGERPEIEQIVIARIDKERFGFCVDQVVGQYQTVVKRLGKLYEGVPGLAGATIMGDGGVAIILDVADLMEAVEKEQHRTAAAKYR